MSSYPKTLFTATVGTILEWAEYMFFAYMADELSRHFFSIEDPNLARLKTYGIFATSYFMRPLGALLFGMIGDKFGRKPALASAMMLMCIATTAIGCLPTYNSVGAIAALLLVGCRLLQGLAVAGEFNGAGIFIFEHSKNRPYFAGCIVPFSASAGMALGAFAAMLVSSPTAFTWSWRIPFLGSGILGLLAIYLRLSIAETPVFQKLLSEKKPLRTPFKTLFQHNKQALFLTMALGFFVCVYVYIGNIYYKTLCVQIGHLEPGLALKISTFGQLLAASLTLIFGLMADRLGGEKLCLLGLGAAIALGPVILSCAASGNIALAFFGQILYAILNGLVSATMMTIFIQAFPPEVRYIGSALGWNFSAAIFGGPALLVAQLLMENFGIKGPSLYISLASLSAFLLLWYTKRQTKLEIHTNTQQGQIWPSSI